MEDYRDIPRKPTVNLKDDRYKSAGYYGCPNCSRRLTYKLKYNYCGHCGQRISWEGVRHIKKIRV